MSLIINETSLYGLRRTLHCLKMMKKMYDEGYDIKKIAGNFTLHASNVYGWSDEGEPILLFYQLVEAIFPYTTILYPGDDEEEAEEAQEILSDMDIPDEFRKEIEDITESYCSLIHIKDEDFRNICFQFNSKNTNSIIDNHCFYTDDEIPIYHFRNKELSEMLIILEANYYYSDVYSLLEFILYIKKQMEE